MLNDLKKTAKHTSVYALGNIATKLIGLLLIPLYTDPKYLSTDDYGLLAVLEASSQLIIGLLTLSMIQNLTRWYWDKNYENQQKSIFFSSLTFLTMVLIPIGGLLLIFSGDLSVLLFKTEEYKQLLQITIGASLIQIINNQVFCLAKLQSRSGLYSALQITKLTLTLLLTLGGILYLNLGLKAIWISALIGEIVTLTLFLPYIAKNIVFQMHFSIIKEMLNYGIPLMLASLSGILLATMDRYMLSSMSGLEETGIYSLGFRIANTLKVVITTSLALAISPLKMKYINAPNNQRFYSKINTYTGFIFTIALLGISLFSFEVIKFFTNADIYWKAYNIVPIISFSLLFGLLKDNTLIGLTITKKTKVIGILIFVTSLLNIGLNILLIPHFGIYGAATATLLSQMFFMGAVTHASQKAYPIPYEWRKLIIMTALAGIFIIIGMSTQSLNLWLRLILKSTLLISFPFALRLFNFYEEVELDTLKCTTQTWRNPRKLKENLQRLLS